MLETLIHFDPSEYSDDDYDFETECMMDQLRALDHNMYQDHDTIIASGYLGLWDGRHPIQGTSSKEGDFIHDVLHNHDAFDIYLVKDEDENGMSPGTIVLYGYHHDGCNVIGFRPMDDGVIKQFTMEEIYR